MKKIKRFLISLFFAFFGTSCGYVPKYYYTRQAVPDTPTLIMEVRVDKDFSDSEKREIDNALYQWNYVLNSHYQFEVIDWNYDATKLQNHEAYYNDAFYFVKINSKQLEKFDIKKDPDNPKPFVLGFAGVGGTLLCVVADRLTQGDIYYVMMHEIAHLLGANHNKFRLMSPYLNYTDFQCVDEKTAIQVAKFLGLHKDDLNWCFYPSDL